MARDTDLMGLGMPSELAKNVGNTPVLTSVAGTSAGTATPIPPGQRLVVITASNSGSGLLLPQVGGDGCNPGDLFLISNLLGATIAIYAANNANGSAVTIYGKGLSAAGTTGISVVTGWPAYMMPLTVSTWSLIVGSA